MLIPCAAHPETSKGRRLVEDPPSYRSEYQRDRDRIVHSAAFRRLEYKTQVFVNHEGDLFRTRLTHSLEVAQIGRSIARTLGLNEDLTEAVALAHDLGHTPFGHAGQQVLNECMRPWGGFEHNLQSLRVVDELEQRYAAFPGLNLTFETREGILKHCSKENVSSLGELGERFVKNEQPSLEAQLANIADEIAYNSHDIDDGVRAGLLDLSQLDSVPLLAKIHEQVLGLYPGIAERLCVHEMVRRLIAHQVIDLVDTTRNNIDQLKPQSAQDVRQAGQAIVAFSQGMSEHNRQIKHFLFQSLYQNYRVLRMSKKNARIISALFSAFHADAAILPGDIQRRLRLAEEQRGEAGRTRVIADYIAGMTDRFALREHDRVFDPKTLA